MPTQTQVIHSSNEPLFDIFGPVLQFLVTPAQSSEAFALMRGMVPPGVAIPLHSHADPEVLFVLEGELNVLQYEGDSSHWVTTRPGEIVCIPGDVRHALRNTSPTTVTLLLTTTPNIYRFFRELGKPFHPDQPLGPPTPQDKSWSSSSPLRTCYILALYVVHLNGALNSGEAPVKAHLGFSDADIAKIPAEKLRVLG
jgi:quercetin dioxygenase-like cupin family protein